MDKLIATIPKNAREVVRVALSEFEGHPMFSARTYYDDGSGEYPARHGPAVPAAGGAAATARAAARRQMTRSRKRKRCRGEAALP